VPLGRQPSTPLAPPDDRPQLSPQLIDYTLMTSLIPHDGLAGKRIGKYEIAEEVGYGGMAVVYRAHDEVLKREVAVKLLHAHLSKRGEARRRFYREATSVAKLRHPNILEVYDFSAEDSAQAYIVMEFIRGPTLSEFVEQNGPLYPEIGAMICVRLAEALAHAHDKGIVHRDVKPENVMIRPDGVIKLMDFGIAQVRDAQKMTETGSLLGSPAHMAPEVIAGEEPDARADIFALGTVLYQAATGYLPFDGRNAPSVLRAISEGRYMDPEMRDPRIGQRLGGVIRKCLENRPDDRYESAEALATDLRACVEEVVSTGIHSELRALFKSPGAYVDSFGERVVDALEARGRTALEQRKVARAVDCFNRVLAIDDGHEGVRKLLGRLDRRRRIAGYGMAAAALLIVGALVGLALGVFDAPEHIPEGDVGAALVATDEAVAAAYRDGLEQTRRDEAALAATQFAAEVQRAAAVELWERTSRHVAEAARLVATAEPVVIDGVDAAALAEREEREREEREEREREEREERARARARDMARGDPENPAANPADLEVARVEESAELVRVRFNVRPRAAEVSIDGGDWRSVNQVFRLSPGAHSASFRHERDYTHPLDVDVNVPETGDVFRRPIDLEWRPARLDIESEQVFQVFVNRSPVGRSDGIIAVPMNEPRIEAQITLVPLEGGGEPANYERELRASQRVTIRVDG